MTSEGPFQPKAFCDSMKKQFGRCAGKPVFSRVVLQGCRTGLCQDLLVNTLFIVTAF